MIVADAGMLSAANLTALDKAHLRFIVGARATRAPGDLEAHFHWAGDAFTDGQLIDTITPKKGSRSERVHPTFLYESLWDVLVFLFLVFIFERRLQKNRGELLFVYFIGYSVGRFFIEGLRTDSLMFFGLRTAQLTSLALIVIGIVGLIWLRRRDDDLSRRPI